MFTVVKLNLLSDGRSQTIELVPSLNAVELINERFGDFTTAYNYVGSLNFDAIAQVVSAGTKVVGNQKIDLKGLKQSLFDTGIAEVMPDVLKFMTLCLNGGREITDDAEEEVSKKKTV